VPHAMARWAIAGKNDDFLPRKNHLQQSVSSMADGTG
jgi:hypothetical protein